LFLHLPRFIKTIVYEHREITKLIEQFHFDIIISDNRYGLWNKSTKSILITHQIMIKTPGWLRFAEYFLYLVSRLMISRFDECWIPDEKEGPGMSGDLSHKYALPANAKFIGPLSRFQKPESSHDKADNDLKIIAIISGPEPQRSIFEQMVTKQLRGLKQESMIIGGKPESTQTTIMNTNLTILPYLETSGLKSVISTASLVVCRSGYSSIMDLQSLGAKALFVPTPGQTEQIYLAKLHQQAGSVLWCNQENLNLKSNIPEALQFPGFKPNAGIYDLSKAIADLKKK
jgi:predicted glycosyltransferase